jgi:hypothetical protein
MTAARVRGRPSPAPRSRCTAGSPKPILNASGRGWRRDSAGGWRCGLAGRTTGRLPHRNRGVETLAFRPGRRRRCTSPALTRAVAGPGRSCGVARRGGRGRASAPRSPSRGARIGGWRTSLARHRCIQAADRALPGKPSAGEARAEQGIRPPVADLRQDFRRHSPRTRLQEWLCQPDFSAARL